MRHGRPWRVLATGAREVARGGVPGPVAKLSSHCSNAAPSKPRAIASSVATAPAARTWRSRFGSA